tara:strand:+ start:908 stop:1228 length:321 start_codon:yes stop_codon:yes gene_type:complete
MNKDKSDNMNEKNLSDHNSKRADELMIKNAQKGLFILQYFTCKSCGDIPDDGKKIDALSKETENTNAGLSGFSVGWTELGLQVWCETCDSNVINFDFKGQKVGLVY